METLATNVEVFDCREPIPGYVLQERIGAGGFGEVWRAEAPGGLCKAVKIVFGQLNADRAARELRALERIKQVRHPMLLSLERIELVQGHLVIVTELADGCLRDGCEVCGTSGVATIAREPLLGYLRDAADALDYLVEQHGLQHLDVKPENLLMVANRVKVADFGLLRDLQDVGESMIAGLTPLYAAPEIFDGRPHRQSDQYSLAIVYQELLTGEPPFGGRTVAQLASQHLHSQPNVAPLPTCDQSIIARALSKSPERRWPNCRALIDELAAAPVSAAQSRLRRADSERGGGAEAWQRRTTTVHAIAAEAPAGDRKPGSATHRLATDYPVPRRVVDLPPLDLNDVTPIYRPSIFIGLGGEGSSVVSRLRRRLRERWGRIDDIPALRFLAIDTDPKAFSPSMAGEPDGWRLHESLLLPLDEPQEYRARSRSLLEWLHRRWLYNMPRSRRTEGLRPLGRLALVDHFPAVLEALHQTIAAAVSPSAIEATSRRTGLDFQAVTPRVFVISSLAGGTGGGMALDLGYTIRELLARLELSDEHLHGLLTFGVPQRAAARDLAVASSVACLSELSQFMTQGYPGEPACGLPARDRVGPFHTTYVAHLGEALDDTSYDFELEELADYLFESTVTPAVAFFDQCRLDEGAAATGSKAEVCVSAFRLRRFSVPKKQTPCGMDQLLLAGLLAQWSGVGEPSRVGQPTPAISGMAASCAERLDLSAERCVEAAGTAATAADNGVGEWLPHRICVAAWDRAPQGSSRRRVEHVLHVLDLELQPSESTGGRPAMTQAARLDAWVREVSVLKANALQRFFAELVDAPGVRTAGARQGAHWLQTFLAHQEGVVTEARRRLEQRSEALRATLEQSPDRRAATLHAGLQRAVGPPRDLLELAELQLLAAAHRAAATLLTRLREAVAESERRLQQTARRFAAWSVDAARELPGSEGSSAVPPQDLTIPDEFPELLTEVDTRLRGILGRLAPACRAPGGDNVAATTSIGDAGITASTWRETSGVERGALLDTLTQIDGATLLPALREAIRGVLASRATSDRPRFTPPSGTEPAELDAPPNADAAADAGQLFDQLGQATPRLNDCGGAKRLLVRLPAESAPTAEQARADKHLAVQPITYLPADDDHRSICVELQQVPLAAVLSTLIRNRSDYLDIAERLHTRIDVPWQPLSG